MTAHVGKAAQSELSDFSGRSGHIDRGNNHDSSICLMSRPPESFGLKPFHVDDAIKSAFNGRPTVFGLTAPQDGVPPTRPINAMARHEIRCSMSRKGNCWDNAVSESFFASLKKELVYQQDYATREEARQSNFQWIETFYNRTRLHSHLGYMSPEQFEQQS